MEWFLNNWETIVIAIAGVIGVIIAVVTKSGDKTEMLGKLFAKLFTSNKTVTAAHKTKLSKARYDMIKKCLSSKKDVETILDDLRELFDEMISTISKDEKWLGALLQGYYLYISSDINTLYKHREYVMTIINSLYDVIDE